MARFHKRTPGLLIVGLLAMHSSASWAADRIGVAASTNPNADGVISGNSQTLLPGSEVYANETVRTGNLGKADLVFVDKTNLTVGPTSEVLLDQFVYDPTGSKGSVVFQATRGAFLFATGTQDHRAYAVNTPYGSLGDAPAVDSAGSLDNFNREFQAMDREARTILQRPLDEHDAPHVGDGGLMAYGPGQNENTGGCSGGVVEVVVAEKGKKLRPDECATRVRLVCGQANFTTTAGKKARLTEPNQTICITANGSIRNGSSSTSILGFQVLAENFSAINTITSAVLTGGTGATTVVICNTPHQLNCVQP
jgi:FecR protein